MPLRPASVGAPPAARYVVITARRVGPGSRERRGRGEERVAANAGNTGMKVLAGIAGFMFLVSWLSEPPEGDPWGSGAD